MTDKKKLPFTFHIPIGDWSGDGHERLNNYRYRCSHPIQEVREAYFTAQTKYPLLDPSTYCHLYDDRTIPANVVEQWTKLLGKPMVNDPSFVEPHEMAEAAIQFLKLGNPAIEFVEDASNTDMLFFYGYDKKKRHISSFGYGLFE